MSPQMIEIVAGLLLKYGPQVAKAVVDLFSKQQVTAADWEAVFSIVRTKEQIYEEAWKRAQAALSLQPPAPVALPQPA